MGEEPRVIVDHIEKERAQLNDAVDEIEARVKKAADWRQHFRRKPAMGLALAFSAGLAASVTLTAATVSRSTGGGGRAPKSNMMLQSLQTALLGFIAKELRGYLTPPSASSEN